MDKRKSVFYIDEDTDQQELMLKRLKNAFGQDISVIAISLKSNVNEMIRCIFKDSNNLRTLVFDERLNETGDANYTGSSLAQAYREFDSVIPIFILTSYPGDDNLTDKYSDYDFVLDKGDFLTFPVEDKIKSLLRRTIGRFDNYVTERSSRMHELLAKSVLDQLTDEESDELNQLTAWRNGPIYLSEHFSQSILKKELDGKEEKIREIMKKLNK